MHITDENGAELSKEKEDVVRLWIEGVYINGMVLVNPVISFGMVV